MIYYKFPYFHLLHTHSLWLSLRYTMVYVFMKKKGSQSSKSLTMKQVSPTLSSDSRLNPLTPTQQIDCSFFALPLELSANIRRHIHTHTAPKIQLPSSPLAHARH